MTVEEEHSITFEVSSHEELEKLARVVISNFSSAKVSNLTDYKIIRYSKEAEETHTPYEDCKGCRYNDPNNQLCQRPKTAKCRHDRGYEVCGDCKYLNLEDKSSVGYGCDNPNRRWKTPISRLHSKSCKACKNFEERT